MDRCALFVDAGYALADGAMAVHGTRRRDSVSWDHAGLLKLLAGLARDRTGLPVLRCYWYEAADGGRTIEHDALAEMPGLKLRLVNTRPGRREGIESQLRRDVVTLAKSGAIADAFIASADEHLAGIVAEVQDLGLRVVVLHIASDGGWTIPQPLRQECDDIVEISGVHLRPFVDLVRGAEPAPAHEQHAAAGYGSQPLADDALISAAMNRAGVPARALPAPAGAHQAPGGSDYGAAQPYANGGQVHVSPAVYDSATSANSSAKADQALMAAGGVATGGGSGQFVDLQRGGSGGQVNGVGAAPISWADGIPPAGDHAGYQQANGYAESGSTVLGGNEVSAAGQGQPGSEGSSTAGQSSAAGQHGTHGPGTGQQEAQGGSGQQEAHGRAGQHAAQGSAGQFPARRSGTSQYGGGAAQGSGASQYGDAAQGSGASQYGGAAQEALASQYADAAQGVGAPQHAARAQAPGASQYAGAADGTGLQQHAGTPQYAGQPQHAAADRGIPQHALPGQGPHPAHGNGAPQHAAHGNGPQHQAHAFGAPIQANAAGGSMHDGAAASASGPDQASAAQAAGAAPLAGTGTGYPDSAATGMHAQSGSYQNGIVKPRLAQTGIPQDRPAHNESAQNGNAQNGAGHHHGGGQSGAAQDPAESGGYQDSGYQDSGYRNPPGASGPAQTSTVHHLSGLSFPPGSAASARNGYPGSQSGNGAATANGFQGGYQNGSSQNGTGVHGAPGSQNGSAQNAPGQYPSFNGFQAGNIQNGSAVNPSGNQAANGGLASGNGSGGRGNLNPDGFEAAPVSSNPSVYGPINPGYFGGQAGPGGQAAAQSSSGQHSMPGSHAAPGSHAVPGSHAGRGGDQPGDGYAQVQLPPAGPSFQPRPPHQAQPHHTQPHQAQPYQAQLAQAQLAQAQLAQAQPYPSRPQLQALPQQAVPQQAVPQQAVPQQAQAASGLPAVRAAQPLAVSLPEAVKAAHNEGFTFGESVGREAPGLWLEAVLARKPRMPSDLEARLLQGSELPIDSLLHDEVRHSLRRGFWDALESARR